MKATAWAPANIAFIKYWGKQDEELRIPANPSISMNLSEAYTITTVEFSKSFSTDTVSEGFDKQRIITHLDRLRTLAGVTMHANIITKNSFPASAGIASSASGFAALTLAAAAALGLNYSQKELTALARVGSGSACRSIPDGIVEWENDTARSLYPHEYWDLRDIICIIDTSQKKTSSGTGMQLAITSPCWNKRQQEIPMRIARLKQALKEKNFKAFGEVIEEDYLDMHHVMQTQTPPLYYWTPETQRVIKDIKNSGLSAYVTIDAGPNVHVMCEAKDEQHVVNVLTGRNIIINKPARGAHIL